MYSSNFGHITVSNTTRNVHAKIIKWNSFALSFEGDLRAKKRYKALGIPKTNPTRIPTSSTSDTVSGGDIVFIIIDDLLFGYAQRLSGGYFLSLIGSYDPGKGILL